MFWDPYFGWDWNEVAQALTFLAVILGFLALFGATEHDDVLHVYRGIWKWAQLNSSALLGLLIMSIIGGFYYWRFQGGDLS